MSVSPVVSLKYQKNASGDYVCGHCSKTCKNQSTMHYHLKKHEGALPHACGHCNQKFLQKSLLDLHISARHQDIVKQSHDAIQCPCANCEYKDIRKGNCLIHFLRVHLKELTMDLKEKSEETGHVASCKGCNKSFKSITQFYYHASGCVAPPETHQFYKEWVILKG
jgi:DNA-directed RNA polymerase subunit RPC12/RpoP